MTGDPISLYRAELRSAAARRAGAYQRRRKSAVAVAVALAAAVLIAGGAIAEQQTRWFNTSSTQLQAQAVQEHVDALARGYTKCMAAHGSHRVTLPGGGWTYQPSAAADSACEPFHAALVATCLIPRAEDTRGVVPRLVTGRVTPARAAACVAAAIRGAAVAR